MKKILIIALAFFCLMGCKKTHIDKNKIKPVVNAISKETVTLSEKELGKPLANAISVLTKESQKYLLIELSENHKLLVFFKENPRFVSTWEYMRKYLPNDCLNPEFLNMLKYANDYASYSGNKLENFIYKKTSDGMIDVLSKKGEVFLARIKPGKIIEVVGDDINNWFLQLKPFPNSKYIINGAEYVTDDAGRIVSTKVKLPLAKASSHRDSCVQKKMASLKGSLSSDDAGHLIGDQFGGSSNMVNLVPMNGKINKGTYKQIEMEWKRAIESGKDVKVDLKLKYPTKPTNCERPDWIEVIYEIDGQRVTKLIKNAA